MDLPERDAEIIHRELFGARPPPRARFFMHGARNEQESITRGYPVHEDRVYVEIKIPDSTDFVSHPASSQEMRQFADAYKQFERIRDWKQHSLELLPNATPAALATAKCLGIFTVEQLAGHDPARAPWTLSDDGDRFPELKGELPPELRQLHIDARRFVLFYNKPRMRLVNGKLEEVPNV